MSSILSGLIAPVTGLLDKFIEDKDQKAMLAHKIATMSEEHHQDHQTLSNHLRLKSRVHTLRLNINQ